MNLKKLKYIVTIAELRSISKAANELFISQPSLSSILSNLEKELGVTLFNRSTSPLSLTYAGEKYVETANKTISEGDVAWNSAYQIIRKRLGTAQQKTIQVAISKLENTSYRDSIIVKDNVEYTLYVNNHKVASGYKARIKNFPADIQTAIKQMRSWASPLYHKEYGA